MKVATLRFLNNGGIVWSESFQKFNKQGDLTLTSTVWKPLWCNNS